MVSFTRCTDGEGATLKRMELATSYTRIAAGGMGLVAMPDPSHLAEAYNLAHPTGDTWRSVRVGPVTCAQPLVQVVNLAVWTWDGAAWTVAWDNVQVRAQHVVTADRGDSLVLALPLGLNGRPKLAKSVSVLVRHSRVSDDTYVVSFAGIDTPRFPC